MNRQQYEALKQERLRREWQPRPRCARCRRPPASCYCPHIRSFASSPEFVILIHKEEAKRGVATGRMSHLCLRNSRLIEGRTFGENAQVNAILRDPDIFPVLLYPAHGAINLSEFPQPERRKLFPENKRLVVFVIDATWGHARRMKRLSPNICGLPTICFTPPSESGFLVRKQPDPFFYSTIEAIHQIIDLFSPQTETRHQNLLEVFAAMVETQLSFGHRNLIRQNKLAAASGLIATAW